MEAADEGMFHSWNPTTGLNDPSSQTPIACLDSSQMYVVTYFVEHCQFTDSFMVSIIDSCNNVANTFISEAFGQKSISVFPNPATDRIGIQLDREMYSGKINIISTYGKIVEETPFNGNTNNQIDISQLPIGMYYIVVTDRYSYQRKYLAFTKQ